MEITIGQYPHGHRDRQDGYGLSGHQHHAGSAWLRREPGNGPLWSCVHGTTRPTCTMTITFRYLEDTQAMTPEIEAELAEIQAEFEKLYERFERAYGRGLLVLPVES